MLQAKKASLLPSNCIQPSSKVGRVARARRLRNQECVLPRRGARGATCALPAFAHAGAHDARASVLECASPLALWLYASKVLTTEPMIGTRHG